MRTKWDILLARQAQLAADLDRLTREINGLARTPFGKPCSGCGTVLANEAEFAAHFVVPDERYMNLGNCPMKQGRDTVATVRTMYEPTTEDASASAAHRT
jgi:hypothetical protein